VAKLPPAHYLACSAEEMSLHRYWTLPEAESQGEWREERLAEELAGRIQEAVASHLVSDVPLGVFLSGGVDSSGVAAFMARAGAHPLKTFSIGFRESGYDERPFARAVAAHLGTDHREFEVDDRHLSVETLERLVRQLDEPLADPAAVATHFLSQMTREHVTVALSGAGGDELFGGYPHYLGDRIGLMADRLLGRGTAMLPRLAGMIPASEHRRSRLRRVKRFLQAAALPKELRHLSYITQLNFSPDRKAVLYQPQFAQTLNGRPPFEAAVRRFRPAAADFVRDAMRVDLETYLVEDVLTLTDKVSMLHSLEVRVPLLDHRLVEFVSSLPSRARFGGFELKRLLRAVVKPLCPKGVFDRPKHGFALPLIRWLGGPLGRAVREIVTDPRAEARGYFRPGEVRALFDRHARGEADESHRIWQLLILELWHRAYVDRVPEHVATAGRES
jgi:asparagine synthase (glutamine-hydrolysing)